MSSVLFVHQRTGGNYITKEEIAFQSKDITSKYLSEKMENKSLTVYGINIPKIIRVLLTNLPDIKVNELRIDNLFELEDGTFALIDYESKYREKNKIKYLEYIVRILKRYEKEMGLNIKIRMIVIYTADISRKSTRNEADIGCLNFRIEEAFLEEMDTEKIWMEISAKVSKKEELTEEEMMQFIVLPLSCKGKKAKHRMVREVFELAKQIEDMETQMFIIAGILAFTDKIISAKEAERIRRWIHMTKVGRLLAEEMEQAVRAARKEMAERVTAQVSKETRKETELRIAERLLEKGAGVEFVANTMEILTLRDVEKLAEKSGCPN